MRRAPLHLALSFAACAASLGSDAIAFQETERVSVDSSGAQGNGDSIGSSVSSDGRFVVFSSEADDLVPGDSNQSWDAFVHDCASGTTERVSVDSAGIEGDEKSFSGDNRAISDDGALVVFQSAATNLDPNDTNSYEDIYVHDRRSGTTTLVSVDSSGFAGNGPSIDPEISGDGRFVVFKSYASNLVANDHNKSVDVFVRDLAAGTTERVSVDSAGNEGNGGCNFSSVSSDGRFVSFDSTATNLVANDTNSRGDVFVRDRQSGTTERVSVDSNGVEASDFSMRSSISADGTFIVFESLASNLVPGDTNWDFDVFLRDRSLGTTSLVSVDSSGAHGDEGSSAPALDPAGRFVVFDSRATNLVAGDTNGVCDVFVHDLVTGETVRSSVDSSGRQTDGDSFFPAIAAGGRVVVFESYADDLVAGDTNGVEDVFVHDLCGASANWTNYGNGLAGTFGIPSLTSSQFPTLGATIDVALSNSCGSPTSGLLVVGLQRASIPTKWGGDLLVLPLLIAPITFSYSGDTFSGAIPDDLAWCGAVLDLQGIEFDPGAIHGVSFSQGLEFVIGH